jgi:hypothetical protein
MKAKRTIARKQAKILPRIQEAKDYMQQLILRGTSSNKALQDAAIKFNVHPAALGGSALTRE